MKNKEEKFCGECCWFYGEDTYGYGCCPFRFAEVKDCEQPCEVPLKFVSKAQMRHHQAVLLQLTRHEEDPINHLSPWYEEKEDAIRFAYRYMKVLSEL